MASQTDSYHMYVVFYSNFAAYIVCRRYKPCEFPGFVWIECWGNKSYYVITSPANIKEIITVTARLSKVCLFSMIFMNVGQRKFKLIADLSKLEPLIQYFRTSFVMHDFMNIGLRKLRNCALNCVFGKTALDINSCAVL